MTSKEIFAKKLFDIRVKRGLSRQKVADDLEITRASLEYYEKGKRTPDINTIVKIAKYFNTTTDYLFGLTETDKTEKSLKDVCDYLKTNEKNVLAVKSIISASKEYSDYFEKILCSTELVILLSYIYKTLSLKVTYGEYLTDLLKKYEELDAVDDKTLYENYFTFHGLSSNEYEKITNNLEATEYKAQKMLLQLIELNCYNPDELQLTKEEFSNCCYAPDVKYIRELEDEILTLEVDLNYRMNNYYEDDLEDDG